MTIFLSPDGTVGAPKTGGGGGRGRLLSACGVFSPPIINQSKQEGPSVSSPGL